MKFSVSAPIWKPVIRLVVKGVYQDSFGFPVEGSICLDVRKRTVHMEADQGDRALSADYQLGHPMHIRTTPKLSKIELNGKQTLIIPDDDSYNRFVKLLRYIAMAGKAGDDPENGVSDTGGKERGTMVAGGSGADGQTGASPESGTDQGRNEQTDREKQIRALARIEDSASYEQLQKLVGLESVKKDVVQLANLMKMQVRRKEQEPPGGSIFAPLGFLRQSRDRQDDDRPDSGRHLQGYWCVVEGPACRM